MEHGRAVLAAVEAERDVPRRVQLQRAQDAGERVAVAKRPARAGNRLLDRVAIHLTHEFLELLKNDGEEMVFYEHG